jgi:hypothetical protein
MKSKMLKFPLKMNLHKFKSAKKVKAQKKGMKEAV